jgi:hypothetical protein
LFIAPADICGLPCFPTNMGIGKFPIRLGPGDFAPPHNPSYKKIEMADVAVAPITQDIARHLERNENMGPAVCLTQKPRRSSCG